PEVDRVDALKGAVEARVASPRRDPEVELEPALRLAAAHHAVQLAAVGIDLRHQDHLAIAAAWLPPRVALPPACARALRPRNDRPAVAAHGGARRIHPVDPHRPATR